MYVLDFWMCFETFHAEISDFYLSHVITYGTLCKLEKVWKVATFRDGIYWWNTLVKSQVSCYKWFVGLSEPDIQNMSWTLMFNLWSKHSHATCLFLPTTTFEYQPSLVAHQPQQNDYIVLIMCNSFTMTDSNHRQTLVSASAHILLKSCQWFCVTWLSAVEKKTASKLTWM